MQGMEHGSQRFLRGEEMAQVRPRVALADRAPAGRIDWILILGIALVLDVQPSLRGKQQPVARREGT